jgi:hypothetical protein
MNQKNRFVLKLSSYNSVHIRKTFHKLYFLACSIDYGFLLSFFSSSSCRGTSKASSAN